jgi:uncharacterized protein (TIGR02246 family)
VTNSTQPHTADTTAVREVLDQVYRAWAAGDADTFAALYTDDVSVVMPGVLNRGRTAVRDHMAAGFAGPLKGSAGVDEPIEIRLYGDTAVVLSTAGIRLAGETEPAAERAVHATWVLVRVDGYWQIAAYANAPVRR